ncbi:hypothetical protein M2272_003556 [Mycobacterium frederiksbergense]|uniref:PE-PPE domain-containing protein n=1 Tax=Mycolicibacterium frederiksbergense TaxID=117567 RepID=A0ABT6L1S2_9MYCO|nr:hypothetical protein [Mycolicibacterium frederiksbergense]MDH6196903.1 hypothetical protein [Mycolicibacterium frederiksbergense]
MQLSLRPYVTAGVALVGAGVIAATPIAPPPLATSATHVSTASVALTAAVDPITRWGQVIGDITEDIGELADFYMQRPLPIATAMANNLQTYAGMYATALPATATNLQNWATGVMGPAIQKAIGELLAGQPQQAAATFNGGLTAVMFALLPAMKLIDIPRLMIDHATLLVKEVVSVPVMSQLMLPLTLTSMAISTLGASAQEALDAFEAGDPIGGLTAIANIPANLANGQLNYFLDFSYWGSCGCKPTGGWVFSQLIKLPRAIADKLAIPTTAALTTTAKLPTATDIVVDAEPAPTAPAGPEFAPVSAPDPAPAADATAPKPDVAAVNASSQGATNLSVDMRAEPGKAVTTVARPEQRLKATLQNAADQADKSLKGIRGDIEKSVKKVSDRIANAGKKKEAASSTAASNKTDKTGSDD